MSTSFLDFNELKSRVSIEQVLSSLVSHSNNTIRRCADVARYTGAPTSAVLSLLPQRDFTTALADAAAAI
jgi:hypothetical protein